MAGNFESKRQELMRELSKRRRENVINRKVSSMHKLGTDLAAGTLQVQKKKLAVFGADSFFMKNMINTLKLFNDVVYNANVEKLTETIMDIGIKNVLVDMDEPTDWRQAVDVFTTMKTVDPSTRVFACTKDPTWVQAETLAKQGAVILKKPVDFDQFYRALQ